MSQSLKQGVTILIPTYRRPDALARALDSALEQDAGDMKVSIMVVDNDAYRSAKPVCEGRRRVTYVNEPRAGVSHARNAGLAANRNRWVFFLDDDMLAQRGCLASLLAAARTYEAAVCFAAVQARMPDDSAISDCMKPFFSRRLDQAEGPTESIMGAGGSLFDLQALDLPTPAFDPGCNETGGEDDVLLGSLQRAGVAFAWVPSAHTVEDVPAHRATLPYLWSRNFAFGQGPTQIAADVFAESGEMSDRLQIAKWMGVGVVQAALRIVPWGFTRLIGSPGHARAHARLAQAVGKVLWWDGFKPRLYGEEGQARMEARVERQIKQAL